MAAASLPMAAASLPMAAASLPMAAASLPIALVFPPQGHFTQPYLALPCLKAYLAAHGYSNVRLIDANVEAYERFLTPDYLRTAAERAARRLDLAQFEGLERLPFERFEAFRAAAESAASAAGLIDGIESAKATVRGAGFWQPEQYLPAVRTLYHALRLVSAAHFPSVLTPHDFSMRYALDQSRDVLAALVDAEENPFLEHFRRELLPRLVALRPRLLGLSVIYGSQLVPALTLGRLVKQALPACHVTAGGGFLAYIGQKLLAARAPAEGDRSGEPAFAGCLDSIVFYEGEQPLLELARALESGTALETVPSLGWYRRRADGGAEEAVVNPLGHPIELDKAPPPDFDGLPFGLYFSPEIVLPYDVNRGCYYGECSFCTLPTVIGPGYRTRRAHTIAAQVAELTARHATRNVNFITDCMPPGMLRDLPEELLARAGDLPPGGIRWWADARVEPKAFTPQGSARLFASGCRKLLFGFESATPRLLELMKKGQSVEDVLAVATNAARAGISVTFYAMVGIPTETRAEARATLDLVTSHADVVREVSLQTFHVDEVSEIYRRPAAFGLSILEDPEADLALYHGYQAATGMTQDEAAEAWDEIMAGLRAALPLFGGDDFMYFMQKSHYFLHLARGATPDEFAAGCRARQARRARGSDVGADGALRPASGLALVRLPFSHAAALRALARPAARAARREFAVGRSIPGTRESTRAAAARAIEPLARSERWLAWAPGACEWAELGPDGARLLGGWREAGDLEAFLERLPAPVHGPAREFARRLTSLGLAGPAPVSEPQSLVPTHTITEP
jgi:radical SAM superfamily enzyme YgiQ (UPF0313 family)